MLPHTVSHFEVFEKLGAGGMGTVFRARDVRLDRIVALKFLSPHMVDSETNRKRFLREGRTLSALNHPHIATVFEVDEDKGIPFLALEFLSGGTLRDRIVSAEGKLPLTTIVAWALALSEGLAHAHRNGVLHRDVKSTNIIFDAEGRPKLTDFGLAKFSSGLDASHADPMVGTIGYIAPELLQGKQADQRSDLFSFGVLLYEAATGKSPFQGDSAARVLQRVLNEDPRPISSVRPDIAPAIENIVARLLQKNPDDRYQNAEEVARDLSTLRGMWSDDRATITTLDAKSAVGGVANSTPSRGRWMAIAGALVLLVAAAFGILNSGFFAPPDLSKNHIAVLPFLSEGGNEDQKVFSDGLTESITNTLTNNEGLSVVPAIDAQKLETPDDAKSRFGATLVLSGSVRRRGEQVRVTINLIDTSAHRQIKSEQIDWPVNKLFDLDQGVLARVAGMLRLSASPQQQEQLAASGSQVAAAQEAFVRGRGYLYRYDKEGNLDSAIQSFETATRLDREFASAYVGLAECHFRKYIQLKQKSFLESSRLSGERALELNPKLASAYVWLGRALAESGQHKDAEAKLLAGVKLDPRDASGFRGLASLYQMENRIADAENAFKQAIAASPGDWTNYSGLASFYSARQRHLDAAAQFRKVIELTPDNPMGYRNLGGLLLQLGNHAEAEVMMKKALDLRPTALAFSNLGALLMMEGRNAEAVPVMESAASLAPAEQPREYRIWGNLGDAYWLSKAPPEKSRAAWKKAVEIAEAQVAAKPPNATLLARIAKYQAKLGNTAEARATIQQAIKLEPSNATVRFQSGIIATLRGDKVRALEELYLAAGLGYPTGEIEKTPELAPLKEEAVFQQLLQQYKAR